MLLDEKKKTCYGEKTKCFLQLTERLGSLAEESHNSQMKKLKDICDK